MKSEKTSFAGKFKKLVRRRLIAGILVILPIYVTYFVIKFLIGLLGGILSPVVEEIIELLEGSPPSNAVEEFVVTAIAFVTGSIKSKDGTELMSIFIPTTPNPTSGFLLYLPESDIIETYMTY